MTLLVVIIIGLTVLGALSAAAGALSAPLRGRRPAQGALLGYLLGPIGLLLLAVLPEGREEDGGEEPAVAARADGTLILPRTLARRRQLARALAALEAGDAASSPGYGQSATATTTNDHRIIPFRPRRLLGLAVPDDLRR